MTIHKKCELCHRYTYQKGYEDAKETTRRDTLLEIKRIVKTGRDNHLCGGSDMAVVECLDDLFNKLERMAEECK